MFPRQRKPHAKPRPPHAVAEDIRGQRGRRRQRVRRAGGRRPAATAATAATQRRPAHAQRQRDHGRRGGEGL